MVLKTMLLKELIKNGYSEENNSKVWNIANTSFWFINPEMSKAFLKLNQVPRYKALIMDTETKLLKENIGNFLKSTENSLFNLIDMNCTDGSRAKTIIKSLPKTLKFRYCPVCFNEFFTKLAVENIKKESFSNITEYAPRLSQNYEGLGEIGAALKNSSYQKNVFLVLGSLISSFEINDYLFKLSQNMLPNDLLVIGNGIRTGERFAHLETYQHPIFNEWFIHLMRILGFKDDEVEVSARFAHNRLEGHYIIKVNKKISFEGKNIEFKKGDKILVVFQYKLYEQELKDFCKMYFDSVELVKDKENEYALVLCKK